MPGCERRGPDDVHIGLDRLPRDLRGSGEQRPDIHVEADVGERGGNDLLPAIVAVLPHLRHENAWSTPLVRGELLDLLLSALQFRRPAHLLGVDTGNGPDRTGVPAPYAFQRVGDFTDGRLG